MWDMINKIFLENDNKLLNKRILLVEEHAQDQTFLHKVLRKKYDVSITRTKKAAYKIALDNKPDLIVLPSKLYGNKTIDLCINLKNEEQTKNIPILVIADNGANIVEYYFQKVEGYLIKPFGGRELLNHATELIRTRQDIVEEFDW